MHQPDQPGPVWRESFLCPGWCRCPAVPSQSWSCPLLRRCACEGAGAYGLCARPRIRATRAPTLPRHPLGEIANVSLGAYSVCLGVSSTLAQFAGSRGQTQTVVTNDSLYLINTLAFEGQVSSVQIKFLPTYTARSGGWVAHPPGYLVGVGFL